MKKKKALSLALVFMMALQMFALPFSTTASAAVKNGLQKADGKTYYYNKGRIVKNKWMQVKGDKYYFGRNGEAYKGYKKVGKYRYFFDYACRMVSERSVKINGGKYYFLYNGRSSRRAVMIKGKIWKTTSGGKMVKNISSLAKEGKDFKPFKKAAGSPLKKETMPSCLGPGKDVNYHYDNFTVSTYEYNGSQKIVAVLENRVIVD